jgi:hypothetical protein
VQPAGGYFMQPLQIDLRTPARQVIENNNLIAAFEMMTRNIAPNKTGSARDEYSHSYSC